MLVKFLFKTIIVISIKFDSYFFWKIICTKICSFGNFWLRRELSIAIDMNWYKQKQKGLIVDQLELQHWSYEGGRFMFW